jgi:CRISPR-associated endonuclease/helicase Cas3
MSSRIHIHLEADYQRLALPEAIPTEVSKVLPRPLQHQIDTLAALQEHDLVINAFPTGTGKTKAVLLWLLYHPHVNTLLIAPVNELVRQHAKDAQQFVHDAGLPHVVAAVDAAYLKQLSKHRDLRAGEQFYRILTNPTVLPELQGYQGTTKPPLLLVTNPDLFYYSVFYLFNTFDRRNIAQQFITKFQYIIIDEVHYYNAKQFANLLFFVLLSKEFGYFDPDLAERRKICFLTATPDTDVNHFIERLGKVGIAVHRLDPEPVAPHDPLATKSLTELELQIHPYTRDAAGEFLDHVEHMVALVEHGKDGAVLLNSLYGVNRLARIVESRLGVQRVGRITGPLSQEERSHAPFKPLLLATPTVDIGFNFEGHPKDRQNLDFVFFEASLEDQFWQRLGRSGRVLGKSVQDVQSLAVALIPDGSCERLVGLIGTQASLSRQALKALVHEAAEPDMQRGSFTEYVQSYALLEIAQPLVEMGKVFGQEHASLLDHTFEAIKSIYAPTSRRKLPGLRGEIQRFQGFRNLLGELQKLNPQPNPYLSRDLHKALRECAQEEYDQSLPEEQVAERSRLVLQNPKAKAQLKEYIAREVAALWPLFSFRDANISIEVEADDPHGLVSSQRETVQLALVHLLRFFQWRLKDTGSKKGESLRVVLQNLCEPPLTVSWILKFQGDLTRFQRTYVKRPTALKGLELELSKEGAIVSLLATVVQILSQQYVPGLILQPEGLKPWMWGSLYRDGLYPSDLTVTFTGGDHSLPSEKKYALFMGLDGYRVMARYGWSIQRETSEWWIV